jgi:hypothetical protein
VHLFVLKKKYTHTRYKLLSPLMTQSSKNFTKRNQLLCRSDQQNILFKMTDWHFCTPLHAISRKCCILSPSCLWVFNLYSGKTISSLTLQILTAVTARITLFSEVALWGLVHSYQQLRIHDFRLPPQRWWGILRCAHQGAARNNPPVYTDNSQYYY